MPEWAYLFFLFTNRPYAGSTGQEEALHCGILCFDNPNVKRRTRANRGATAATQRTSYTNV